jgi:hypothetical protein
VHGTVRSIVAVPARRPETVVEWAVRCCVQRTARRARGCAVLRALRTAGHRAVHAGVVVPPLKLIAHSRVPRAHVQGCHVQPCSAPCARVPFRPYGHSKTVSHDLAPALPPVQVVQQRIAIVALVLQFHCKYV